MDAFRRLDAEVLGVNSGSLESHKNFSDRNEFVVPLLSDEGGDVTGAYKARHPKSGGTIRTVYIVDREGIIRYAKRGKPPHEELLEVLRDR
ncbi:hypothetical protein CEE37_01605 [candidate division LCP-89 bacterium B3_LCP]|uniref:Alkyl hydroperoxide reductase subunit C/ Thiol specific antioxidant domain-containing protein n=1 Tax=candidate division LCP-89 bacterium B3_LCP TaxID=2012998 RepID=A0A532V5C5_UNCL8|nr:MAG: hypothetical protein CEE37_01605 [candidate division LCP-89 bacterium B3_LCP]